MKSLFFLFLLATGCGKFSSTSSDPYRLVKNFATEQKMRRQLELLSIGISQPRDIEGISLELVSHQCLNLAQARQLYLACAEELLAKINASESLHDDLGHYPMTAKDLEFRLAFWDDQESFYKAPAVAYVTLLQGYIHYMIWQEGRLEEAYRETYEEALMRLSS